jgi:2-keto-4-pentenoate hydratase/2-oxohepta-3-ene-1,7-dioic acid hydratase in catechol pathway
MWSAPDATSALDNKQQRIQQENYQQMRFGHLRDHSAPLAGLKGNLAVPLHPRLGLADVDELIAAGPQAWSEAERVATEAIESADAIVVSPTSLLRPLLRPSKIACIGLNYQDHIRETGMAEPKVPLVFAKFPSALADPGQGIEWPSGLTHEVDWEAELAVVLGRRIRNASVADCLAAIFGYTAANDISARDLQMSDGQWVRAKSLDTFCPLGPTIVTADDFGSPEDKQVICRVNGKKVQDARTSAMIFGVGEILSFLSHNMTMEPGDLVLTGTPWGAGGFSDPPTFLAAGDLLEVEIEGVGVLANPVTGPAAGLGVSAVGRDKDPSAAHD